MIKTIIFDMDGTLIDTELAAAKSIRGSFQDWGIAVSETDSAYITGRTWQHAFDFLFGKYALPIAPEEAAKIMLARYREEMRRELIEVPGAALAVKALSAEYPLALVSGSHREEIFYAVDQLGIRDCFQVILGAEDYPRSKPAPDGFLKALKLMSADPATTLVFEDSEAGIESGLAAGLKVCAITSTNHFGVNTKKAHHFIPDLTGVDAAWIQALKFAAASG